MPKNGMPQAFVFCVIKYGIACFYDIKPGCAFLCKKRDCKAAVMSIAFPNLEKYILAADSAAERRILHYGFCFLADSSTNCTYNA